MSVTQSFSAINTSAVASVLLFSDYSPLSVHLCKALISKKCFVSIVSPNPSSWKSLHLTKEEADYCKLSAITQDLQQYPYGIYLSPDLEGYLQDPQDEDIGKFLQIIKQGKKLLLFPYLQQKDTAMSREKLTQDIKDNTMGIIYGAYTVFPGLPHKKVAAIRNASNSLETYAVKGDDFVKKIIRLLFSFGAYSQQLAIIPNEPTVLPATVDPAFLSTDSITSPALVDETIILENSPLIWQSKPLAFPQKEKEVKQSFQKKRKKTKPQVVAAPEVSTQKELKVKSPSRHFRRMSTHKFRSTFLLPVALFILLFFPVAVQMITRASLPQGFSYIERFDYEQASKHFGKVKSLTNFGSQYAQSLTAIPVVGSVYNTLLSALTLQKELIQVGESASTSLQLAGKLIDSITTGEGDVLAISQELSLAFGNLYKETSFLQGDLAQSGSPNILKDLQEKNPVLSAVITNALDLQKFVTLLPTYIGEDKPSNVAVLFQDNRFSTASGGRITGVALISFSSGKIANILVFSPQDIDKQAKGMMEAPNSLVNLVNSSNWRFQDAAWQADFSEASKDVARFVEHTLGITVNGVVALPLSPKETAVLGITSEDSLLKGNVTQGVDLHNKLSDLSKEEKNKMVFSALTALQTRDMALMLPGEPMQDLLSKMRWNGSFDREVCNLGNCYSDAIAVIETNASNVPSASLKKSADLSVRIEEGSVKRNLTVSLTNNGETEYKGYVRVVIPADSGAGATVLETKEGAQSILPTATPLGKMKELGLMISISAKDETKIALSWESYSEVTTTTPGKYKLNWYKQIGKTDLDAKTTVYLPPVVKIDTTELKLTGDGVFSYNTALTEDKYLELVW